MEIELTKGQSCIIDAEDYDKVKEVSWYAHWQGNRFYAATGTGGFTYMHRLLIDVPENMVVDHINRNSLDNRKCNLRVVTQAENLKNRKIYGTSIFKGVSYEKSKEKWMWDFEGTKMGGFATEIEAYHSLIQFRENCE